MGLFHKYNADFSVGRQTLTLYDINKTKEKPFTYIRTFPIHIYPLNSKLNNETHDNKIPTLIQNKLNKNIKAYIHTRPKYKQDQIKAYIHTRLWYKTNISAPEGAEHTKITFHVDSLSPPNSQKDINLQQETHSTLHTDDRTRVWHIDNTNGSQTRV